MKTHRGPIHAVLFRECCAGPCILSAECVTNARFVPCVAKYSVSQVHSEFDRASEEG